MATMKIFEPEKERDFLYSGNCANWFRFLGHTPMSEPVDESNYRVAVNLLTEKFGNDGWEIERYSHWGCGWVEGILVNPAYQNIVDYCNELLTSIQEDYPLIDEDDYCNLCAELGLEEEEEEEEDDY